MVLKIHLNAVSDIHFFYKKFDTRPKDRLIQRTNPAVH